MYCKIFRSLRISIFDIVPVQIQSEHSGGTYGDFSFLESSFSNRRLFNCFHEVPTVIISCLFQFLCVSVTTCSLLTEFPAREHAGPGRRCKRVSAICGLPRHGRRVPCIPEVRTRATDASRSPFAVTAAVAVNLPSSLSSSPSLRSARILHGERS